MDGSPLSESEERDITEALAGVPRAAFDPPPPSPSSSSSSSSSSLVSVEGGGGAITSEDAEAALAELDQAHPAPAPVPDFHPPPPVEDHALSDPELLAATVEEGAAGEAGPEGSAEGAAPAVVEPGPEAGEGEERARGDRYAEPPPLPVVEGDEEAVAAAVKPARPSEEHEIFFGELARLQRFVTSEQVAEALRVAARLRAEGRPKKIGKIMVKLGYLTATQAKYLLRLQRTPDPIEGYKLLERRGQGGMGVVYRAVQKSMGREVALKILAPKWATHARFLQRFFREAKLAGTLNHPNIVAAIDIGESNGLHYYAMEYVDGWSVAEILKEDGPFEESEALDIVLQVGKALKEASAQAIVHRDVKPENILVTPDGVAKLADLGLSKQMTADCSITTEGKTLGTPFYVSPELARGLRDVDVRSDIYSLGATLYHMLVGSPPFDGDQPATIMARHIAEEHVPVKRRRPDISKATTRLVDRMMAKDPAKRYQTADELVRDVIAIRKGRNPFLPGAQRMAAATAKAADNDSASTRLPVQPVRRPVTSPGERPAYARHSGAYAGVAASVLALLTIVIVSIVVARRERGAQPRPPAGGAAESAAAGVGPAAPAPDTTRPVWNAERERIAGLKYATLAPEIGNKLDQGRFAEAALAADALLIEVAGTAAEGPARKLQERVNSETRKAVDLALHSARRALADGDPRLAKELLESAPRCDAPDVAAERARLKDEIERQPRGR